MGPYTARPGWEKRASPEEMFTIRPPSLMSGSSFCDRRNGALKWTANWSSSSASVPAWKVAVEDVPALLTR